MYRTVFWTLWERARVGWFGRMALKHVYYHMWNESPVQVWCMIQGARGWYTGMTQRDVMGRELGRGFRMGNTCTPVADSCWCMAKPIQYCKVKKNNKKKKWKTMDCSPPGSSVSGIIPARILEWVVISSSRESSWPKDWTHVSSLGRWILNHWATWEAQTVLLF